MLRYGQGYEPISSCGTCPVTPGMTLRVSQPMSYHNGFQGIVKFIYLFYVMILSCKIDFFILLILSVLM